MYFFISMPHLCDMVDIINYKFIVPETLFSCIGASMSGQISQFTIYQVALDLAVKNIWKRSLVGRTESTGPLSLDKSQTSQTRRSELPLELINRLY